MPSDEIPAAIQRELQISEYVLSGSAAILLWDILNNIRNDYLLLFKHRFQLTSAVYLTARCASVVYILGLTIYATNPFHACESAYVALDVFMPIGVSANTFLFFSRVRAIYGGDRLITFVFGFLWLSVVAGSLTIPIGTTASGLPGNPTECVVTSLKKYTSASGVTLAVNDSLVFIAISYRLFSDFSESTWEPGERKPWWGRLRALLTGADLPAFAKSLFTDGQMYYMITVFINIVATALVLSSVDLAYRCIPAVLNFTLTGIMACRVYRNTKLNLHWGGRELTLPTLNSLTGEPLSLVLRTSNVDLPSVKTQDIP
ncbi:hypothetical protein FB45DRAFT_782893 [Roridomyces roridus]|uniref:Uncharacterized protein n=1 Tax=Roridomyces roridus TaxID=1738132 RepID=A0AAD7CGD0_9AGAR|nr:hypothetical protein FB45DRAFT_782893 [Roridomyces roridus]